MLFWKEVIAHAKHKKASAVIIVTRDRKGDWYFDAGPPKLAPEWQNIRRRWLPVPSPHPTLAYELRMNTGAELVLMDELYLGAPSSIAERALKRRERAQIGLQEAKGMLDAALGGACEDVMNVLDRLDQDAPIAEEFVDSDLLPNAHPVGSRASRD